MRKATQIIEKSTLPGITKWNLIDWKTIESYVEKLQQRIYRAESLGQKRTVRNLQRLLARSKAAILLSIRRITQKNKGRKTAGIDKVIICTDRKRLQIYNKICQYTIALHRPKESKRIQKSTH